MKQHSGLIIPILLLMGCHGREQAGPSQIVEAVERAGNGPLSKGLKSDEELYGYFVAHADVARQIDPACHARAKQMDAEERIHPSRIKWSRTLEGIVCMADSQATNNPLDYGYQGQPQD